MSNKIIHLPEGCHINYPSVHPLNWLKKGASIKQDWYINYRFHDPKYSNNQRLKYGLQRSMRGMNSEKTLEKRRQATRVIIEDEIKLLKDGYNPITGKTISKLSSLNFELSPNTPFVKALWKAVDKIKVSPNYLIDVKCMVRGIQRAAEILNISEVPVSQITRKYITVLFEKCSELNKRWSARRHNSYRTALICLYRRLIAMEAVDYNIIKDIEKMKETHKIRDTLTKEQRVQVDDFLHKNYYSFWRFVQIFYASGARITELVNIQIKEVDLKSQIFVVTIKKGRSIKQTEKPITNDILYLWKELTLNYPVDYYIFSNGLMPGKKPMRPDQVTKRWLRHVKKKLGITADLYSNKHLRTTSISKKYGTRTAAKLNSHANEGMVRKIYDVDYDKRELEKMKNIKDSFAGK